MHTFYIGGPLTGKTQQLVRYYLDCPQPAAPLFLSFYETTAEDIRIRIEQATGTSPPWVATMQRFIFYLLREYAVEANLPPQAEAISALERSLIIRQAWRTAGGDLWKRYRETPGGTEEITRGINWLSMNRRRFTVENQELADHELTRIYTEYIDICRQHRLLTFQESGLRAVQLLEKGPVADAIRGRFPVIIVDDLHQARPDQLALIEALVHEESTIIGSAWLSEQHHDPGLSFVRSTIDRLGGRIETLPDAASGVNPYIHAVTMGSAGTAGRPGKGPPITLITGETVEDETAAVAQAVDQLCKMDTAEPGDILIICMDASSMHFMTRHLARAEIPVADLLSSQRLNPYIRAGMLIGQWHARGLRYTVLNRILRLPLFTIDPLDLRALETVAREAGQSVLELSEADYPDTLRQPLDTAETMMRIRRALAYKGQGVSFAELITQAIEVLDDGETINTVSPDDAVLWREKYEAWLEKIRALEATAATLSMRSREVLPLIDRLVDEVEEPPSPDRVFLTDAQGVEGLRRPFVFITGLSENAMPRLESPFQIIDESKLSTLFSASRPVVLPAHRDQKAWSEREGRRLAMIMSRASKQLTVSVSRYTATGDAQLPSPFFETLLGEEGEIDRDGRIQLSSPVCWTQVNAPRAKIGIRADAPSVPTDFQERKNTAEKVLRAQIYSASQIRTYLRCPLQFFYDRVLHLDSDESPAAMKRGALLHLILCAVLGDGTAAEIDMRNTPRPPWLDDADLLTQRAFVALEAAWKGEAADLPGGGRFMAEESWADHFGPRLQREAVGLWARGVLSRWADFEVNGRRDRAQRRPVMLEVPFSITIDGYLMIGRIDRIDEVVADGEIVYDVIDYKTGSAGADSLSAQINKFLPRNEGDPATDYQLPIYGLALQEGVEGLSATPRYLTYINLDRLDKTARDTFRAEASRSVQLVETDAVDVRKGLAPVSSLNGTIYEGIRTTLHAMSSSPYPATPGFHCRFCGFQSACSRGQSYDGGE